MRNFESAFKNLKIEKLSIEELYFIRGGGPDDGGTGDPVPPPPGY